jgi:cell wall assembly regulator SMI1
MKEIWERIHHWLRQHAPAVLDSLRPGAGDQTIRAAEEALGLALPADVRESYSIHDGQAKGEHGFVPALVEGQELLPLEAVVAEWGRRMERLAEGAEHEVPPWHPAWVPLLRSGDEGACLDLSAPEGTPVLAWVRGGLPFLFADSFTALLEGFASDLEGGVYEYDEESGGLVSTGEPPVEGT